MEQKNNAASELALPKRQEVRQGLTGSCSSSALYHGPAQKSTLINDFTAIRERVTAEDVAHHYGLQFDRSGKKALCPFHNDKHPSLSFYRGGFKCFACGKSGSSLDLTMQLLGLDLKGAAARLNDDFHLNLDREPTAEERAAARKVQDARRMFEEWREQTLNLIDAAIRVANTADLTDLTDAEALAVRHREHLENVADVLLHSPISDQMQIFRERKEVETLCQSMLTSLTKSRTA